MDAKKKVLFVTTVDLQIESGGTRYSKSVLNALSSSFIVQTMTLAYCQKINNRKFRWLSALVKSLFVGVPPNVLFHSGLLRNECRAILKKDWDVVIVDHLESSYVLKYVAGASFVYVSQNRESELIDQKLPRVPSWIKNILRAWIERCEISLSRTVGGVVSISNLEAEWYRKYSNNVGVLYPVFDLADKQVDRLKVSDVLRVGFLGSGSWRPNAEAVEILIHEIFPLTKRKIEFVLAGGAWKKEEITSKVECSSKNLNVSTSVFGYVPDIQTFWSSIDVFAAPIVSGAGVNVKVCEALANGVSVVALPHAVRGMTVNIITCGGLILAPSEALFSSELEAFQIGAKIFPPPHEFSPFFAEQSVAKIVGAALKGSV